YRFGQLVQNEPSRFIDVMPEQPFDKSYAGGGARNLGADWGGGFERMQRGSGLGDAASGAEKRYGPPPAKKTETHNTKPEYLPITPPSGKVVEHTPSTNFVASDTANLGAGQQVEHQKFGFGTVAKIEGSAHNPVATIQFKLNGEKKIMLNYAKLRIVE
ncbi:MAG: ATP-dependent DNA helicase, partial [Sediminibacterium sp.]|nr:ATP-dependent DNA helicase [Sediminibacterium sp.]